MITQTLMTVLGLLLITGTLQARADAPTLILMTWNVENLFDAEDDPDNPGDDEFTPESWRRWTEARYQAKLTNLAEIIALSEADFVAVQEVENRRVLNDLTRVLRTTFGRDYPHIVHREGPDHRGVDVALLAMYPPVTVDWFTPVPGQRDVLQVLFTPHGVPLTLLVNHWKSRWEGQAKTALPRMIQAEAVHEAVERLLAGGARQAIVVMGDFNDDCVGPALDEGLRTACICAGLTHDASSRPLLNLHTGLAENERGTFYYARGQVWNSFDSMHASHGMTEETPTPGWKILPETYTVLRWEQLLDPQGRPKAFRRVTQPNTRLRFYQYGYSDHLPVRLCLRLQTGPAAVQTGITPGK